MSLSREKSLATAGATAALVYATFAACLPTVADVRAAQPNDQIVNGTVRAAAWTATGIVIATALITKDATVFIAGGATIVALTWMHRHANMYDATTGRAVAPSSRTVQQAMLADGAGSALS